MHPRTNATPTPAAADGLALPEVGIDHQSTSYALLLWLPRHPLVRLTPVLVGPVARLALRWLRRYQPAVFAAIRHEFEEASDDHR